MAAFKILVDDMKLLKKLSDTFRNIFDEILSGPEHSGCNNLLYVKAWTPKNSKS